STRSAIESSDLFTRATPVVTRSSDTPMRMRRLRIVAMSGGLLPLGHEVAERRRFLLRVRVNRGDRRGDQRGVIVAACCTDGAVDPFEGHPLGELAGGDAGEEFGDGAAEGEGEPEVEAP